MGAGQQPTASFKCSLDGANFTACTSPVSYTNLNDSLHSFQVEAVAANTAVSSPTAAIGWLVDTKAPQIKLTFVHDHGPFGTASWNVGCAVSGFCGTASDDNNGSGIASVSYSLQQVASGKWWNGSAFSSSTAVWIAGTGTTAWSAAFPASKFPADGDYTVAVQASDGAGNVSQLNGDSQDTFTVDQTPPPAPTFKQPPAINADHIHFEDQDAENGVAFQCSLDNAAYLQCGSGTDYDHLTVGIHRFCVEALDKAGNPSLPLCYTWQVGTSTIDIRISGAPLSGVLLYPGGPDVPVNLTFVNNTVAPATIASVNATVTGVTPLPSRSCSKNDFSFSRQLTASPTIPQNATASLSSLAVPQLQWPQLRMVSSGNQDGCKGATVILSFTFVANG